MITAVYYGICGVLSVGVLLGIHWMSQVDTAARGNRLSALCMGTALIVVMLQTDFSNSLLFIGGGLLIGVLLSWWMTTHVKMIQMPQFVALLNGLGGLSSMLAAYLTLNAVNADFSLFELTTAGIAMMIGVITFSGSLIAVLKLHRLMTQRAVFFSGQNIITFIAFFFSLAMVVGLLLFNDSTKLLSLMVILSGMVFGLLFALRVGGADMPITISLLNSTSGMAAAITGMALGNVLLVSVGSIVGASGLVLTQIMCKAMNRSLASILFGIKRVVSDESEDADMKEEVLVDTGQSAEPEVAELWLQEARDIILIPGYGMALSQAQELVMELTTLLEQQGKRVRFAIHPVAGRMPGHMNVLLAEVEVPYEKLFEMDNINPDFPTSDLVIVIGANDVINPAANTQADTPIYGMPVLNVEEAGRLIICNFDLEAGYSGVKNPLYEPSAHILMMLGDAKESLEKLISVLKPLRSSTE